MTTATKRWTALVEENKAAGRSSSQAIKEVARLHPSLHEQYQREAHADFPDASWKPGQGETATEEWHRRVEQRGGGAVAIRAVAKLYPELHAAYLREANADNADSPAHNQVVTPGGVIR